MPIDSTEPADDGRRADPDAVDALDAAAEFEPGDDIEALEDVDGRQDLDDLDDLEGEAEMDSDAALIARAKKRYGIGGAMLAGGMLGLDRMLTGKVKPDAPVQWEAAGEPLDIDRKGIDVPLEDERIVRSRPGPAAAAGATSRRVTRRRRG
jgi:hypothetical protein